MTGDRLDGTAVRLEPLTTIQERAHSLIEFCAGLEDAGLTSAARRSRACARDVLELTAALSTERIARQAMQAQRDQCLAILANRAGQALREETGAAS